MKPTGNDSYELTTGKVIHPNNGIIGLREVEGFKIFEGYDGSWITESEEDEPELIELTNEEVKEIALYMSELWLKFYTKL